jgi:hypothetical protein
MHGLDTRGILDPTGGEKHFRLSRHAPPEDLAFLVEWHWIVRWDLRGREPYEAQTLPFPAINLVVQEGRSAVHGPMTRRFTRVLTQRGHVVGTRFRPGAFVGFTRCAMADLADRTLPLREVFGPAGSALEASVLGEEGDAAQVARVHAFLRDRMPPPDPGAVLASRSPWRWRRQASRVSKISRSASACPLARFNGSSAATWASRRSGRCAGSASTRRPSAPRAAR